MLLPRLRLPQIDLSAGPKQVTRVDIFRILELSNRQVAKEATYHLIDLIRKGVAIPDGYYRQSLRADPVLEKTGIMHLHTGDPNSSDLIWLIQYKTAIVLLEVSDHRYFEDAGPPQFLPPAHKLIQFHDPAIQRLENPAPPPAKKKQ